MTELSGWENYYVIVGSSAGALIGLQFVVLTLMAERPVSRDLVQAGNAFATPNILHFGSVLLLSGILSAPWRSTAPVAVMWGVLGICGLIYSAVVTRRMRRQKAYQPVFEDWLFHSMLPFFAYAVLAFSATISFEHPAEALFAVAGSAMLLLFIGIHNAWDAVTYQVFVVRKKDSPESSD